MPCITIAAKPIPKVLALEEMPFEVEAVEVRESKKGEQMLMLKLKVTDSLGVTKRIYDFLLTTAEKTWKLYKFADAIGMEDDFASGQLNTDHLIGQTGWLKVNEEEINNDGFAQENATRYFVEYYMPSVRG